MTGGTAPGPALVAEGLVSTVRGGQVVLDDVSLRVGRGEVVAIIGGSGAGTTTLLEALGPVIATWLVLERRRRTAGAR